MRFVIVGAGAIGATIGGRLFERGHEVVLVARGAHLEALTRNGLSLESPGGAVTLHIPAVAGPSAVAWREGDVAVLAVKSQDTLPAVRALADVAQPATPVICAQNGLENERVALRSFRFVYGMNVMCPATHLSPGAVQAHSAPVTGILDLGRWPSGADALAEDVAAVLSASTFVSQARADIARWKRGKLMMNLANAVEALFGPDARGGEVVRRARQEAAACFEAADLDYVDRAEDLARRGELLKVLPVGGQGRGGGSSWQSLTRQTGAIETDFLNGEIVLLGRLTGVPTPVNEALQRLADVAARHRQVPGAFTDSQVADAASHLERERGGGWEAPLGDSVAPGGSPP